MKVVDISIPVYGDGIIGDIPMKITEQCLSCIHLHDDLLRCDAFPEGLPEYIRQGHFDHTKPYDGDHGIQYVSEIERLQIKEEEDSE
jgi:hypothetical protein